MKKVILIGTLGLFLLVLAASPVLAAETAMKIGFVDLFKAVNESEQGKKAKADLEQAEHNMAALTLTSPVAGIITILSNSQSRTTITGSSSPFREGDRAYAGAAIAEIPDMSTLQGNASITEADRGRVTPGPERIR